MHFLYLLFFVYLKFYLNIFTFLFFIVDWYLLLLIYLLFFVYSFICRLLYSIIILINLLPALTFRFKHDYIYFENNPGSDRLTCSLAQEIYTYSNVFQPIGFCNNQYCLSTLRRCSLTCQQSKIQLGKYWFAV